MSLSSSVREFLRQVKRQGGSSPELLEALERSAATSFQGAFVTQTAPMADRTWELNVNMLGANLDTATDRLSFPRPVEIVGIYPSIVVIGAVGRDPTVNDIACELDVNNSDTYTTSQGKTGPSSRAGAVTLGALSILAPRLMGLKIDTVSPNLGIGLRWKAGPASTFKDSLVSLAVFCRWL